MSGVDAWNPDQYQRYQSERSQPFHDLLALCQPAPGGRVVDLGCGTGELTRTLHRRLQARETVGIDTSAAMLERSRAFAGDGLTFAQADLASFEETGWSVVFSNAALQWVSDHESLLARLAALIAPGGQLAVQVPANHDHLSHTVAAEVAGEEPFRTALGGYLRASPVLAPERYAELLERLGFRRQNVRLQVYGHPLGTPDDVVEWVKGTLLTDYEKRLGPLFPEFLARYRERLLPRLGDRRPYFFAFKRILFWARRE